MLKLLEKKSVIYIWSILCIIILIFPMATNIYVLMNIHHQLKSEIYTTNKYLMKNISQTLDNVFSEVNTLNIAIQKNDCISSISKMESVSSDTKYLAANATNELYYKKINSQYISDAFIYFPKLDLIITPSAFYESETYYRYHINKSGERYKEWKDFLISCKYKTIMDGNIVNNDDEDEDVIRFIEPMGKNGFIINTYINKYKIFKDIEEIDQSDKKSILLLNSRNEILYRYGAFQDNNKFKQLHFENDYDIKYIDIDNVEFVTSFMKSKTYRYQYIYITPSNVLRQKINQALIISILVNGLCLLLMSIIIVYFTKWNYKKISSILGNLTHIESKNSFKNEYQLIEEKIKSAKDLPP